MPGTCLVHAQQLESIDRLNPAVYRWFPSNGQQALTRGSSPSSHPWSQDSINLLEVADEFEISLEGLFIAVHHVLLSSTGV
mmetsp:Transcript_28747/g.61891  ORF Transcript_28747/g.61891 Transcript_28747/m.61891 type:complete len:81 (-) Transcript_28747:451-693(-)